MVPQQKSSRSRHASRSRLEDMDRNIHDILYAIKGDPNKLNKGLVQIVNDHETRIKSIENLKNRAIWVITGASTTGLITGFTAPQLIEIITKLLK